MIRSLAAVAAPLAVLALAACQQEQEAPAVPPTTNEAFQAPDDLIIPPEETEVPPATGQTMPDTPPIAPETGPQTSPAQSPPPPEG